ncbi:MAG: TIM barrel protein [Candidatus Hodarchaeales archaeon]|jgi:sugar phosphate isomerase/epimerase
MTFTTGLTIQRTRGVLPSKWVEIASIFRLQHIEFDQTVFEDIENVIHSLKAHQTVIHAPYVEDYGIDLSSNDQTVDQFVGNVIDTQQDLHIIGIVIHPPTDASGSLDSFYERLEKLPFPLLENMPYQSWEEFLQFVDNIQANVSNRLGMCFDIPHSWMTNGKQYLELPEPCLNFLQASTGYIHISGGTQEEDTHFPLLSEGDMPIDPVKDFLNDIDFSGTVTMELRPQSRDDLGKIFQSYMIMLGFAGKNRHKFQVKVKKPFILRKIRQLTKKTALEF